MRWSLQHVHCRDGESSARLSDKSPMHTRKCLQPSLSQFDGCAYVLSYRSLGTKQTLILDRFLVLYHSSKTGQQTAEQSNKRRYLQTIRATCSVFGTDSHRSFDSVLNQAGLSIAIRELNFARPAWARDRGNPPPPLREREVSGELTVYHYVAQIFNHVVYT